MSITMNQRTRALSIAALTAATAVTAWAISKNLPNEVLSTLGGLEKRTLTFTTQYDGGPGFSHPVMLLVEQALPDGSTSTSRAEVAPNPDGTGQAEVFLRTPVNNITVRAWAETAIEGPSATHPDDYVFLNATDGARSDSHTFNAQGSPGDSMALGTITMKSPPRVIQLGLDPGSTTPSTLGYSLFSAPWTRGHAPTDDPWASPDTWRHIGVAQGGTITDLYSWSNAPAMDIIARDLSTPSAAGTATSRLEGDVARLQITNRARVLGTVSLTNFPEALTVLNASSGAISPEGLSPKEIWNLSQSVMRNRSATIRPDGSFEFGLLGSGVFVFAVIDRNGQEIVSTTVSIAPGANVVQF